MNKVSENPIIKKTSELFGSLCDLRIKEEHDLTLKLYDKSSPDSPECEHCISGYTDRGLIKTVMLIGTLSLIAASFCAVRSLIRN